MIKPQLPQHRSSTSSPAGQEFALTAPSRAACRCAGLLVVINSRDRVQPSIFFSFLSYLFFLVLCFLFLFSAGEIYIYKSPAPPPREHFIGREVPLLMKKSWGARASVPMYQKSVFSFLVLCFLVCCPLVSNSSFIFALFSIFFLVSVFRVGFEY